MTDYASIPALERRQLAADALKAAQRWHPTIQSFARAMTNDPSIKVVFWEGHASATDGSTIYIVPPIQMAEKRHHQRRQCNQFDSSGRPVCTACQIEERLLQVAYHEVAHITEGSFEPLPANAETEANFIRLMMASPYWIDPSRGVALHGRCKDKYDDVLLSSLLSGGVIVNKKAGGGLERHLSMLEMLRELRISPFVKLLLNAIEDSRVNRSMGKVRPGVERMFRVSSYEVFEHGIETLNGRVDWRERDVDSQMAVALHALLSGYFEVAEMEKWFAPRVYLELLQPEAEQFANRLTFTRNTSDMLALVADMFEHYQGRGFWVLRDDDYGSNDDDTPQDSDDDTPDGDPGEGDSGSGDSGDSDPDGDSEEPDSGDAPDRADDGDSDGGSGGGSDGDDGEDEGDDSDEGSGGGSDGDDGEDEGDDSNDGDGNAGGGSDEDDDGSEDDSSGGDGSTSETLREYEERANRAANDLAIASGHPEDVNNLHDQDLDSPGESKDEHSWDPDRSPNKIDVQTVGSMTSLLGSFDNESKVKFILKVPAPYDLITTVNGNRLLFHGDTREASNLTYRVDNRGELDEIAGRYVGAARMAFSANKAVRAQRGLKRGAKLDAATVGRRVVTGDDRIFRRKIAPTHRSYSVMLSIDVSGSASFGAWRGIKQSSYAQAEVLHRLGIDFAFYAHGVEAYDGARSFHKGAAYFVIKEFGQPWDDQAKLNLDIVKPESTEFDGTNIRYLRNVLEGRRSTNKILLYYTDGMLCDQDPIAEQRIIKEEVDVFRRRDDIELLAIAVGTDSPTEFGLDYVRYDEPDDLKKVLDELKTRLTRV